MRAAVEQHLHALDSIGSEVHYHNAYRAAPRWLRVVAWDLVVLHTTFLCMRWDPSFPTVRRQWAWLRRLECSKVALPQDEYDHAFVLDEWLDSLGVDTVFSTFDRETNATLYPS